MPLSRLARGAPDDMPDGLGSRGSGPGIMETITLRVTGMTCGGCENAVKRAVGRLDGVSEVSASHVKQEVAVMFDPVAVTPDQIQARIAAAGYTVVG